MSYFYFFWLSFTSMCRCRFSESDTVASRKPDTEYVQRVGKLLERRDLIGLNVSTAFNVREQKQYNAYVRLDSAVHRVNFR